MTWEQARKLVVELGLVESRLGMMGGSCTETLRKRERKAVIRLLTALMGESPVTEDVDQVIRELS